MCEIQFVKNLNGKLTKKEYENFYNMLVEGSYYNADAWGICNEKRIVKDGDAFFVFDKYEDLYKQMALGRKFLIGHNRLATQGDKKDNNNNHPFESKNYFLVHNGVIRNDDTLKAMKELFYKEETDSVVILELLQALKDKGFSTPKAIKRVAELLDGSFSVLIYDKKAKKNYYFKNSKTSFSFALVTNGERKTLYGSTSEDNFEWIDYYKEQIFKGNSYDDILITEAESGQIYEITNTEIRIIGSFKEKKDVIKSYSYGYPQKTTWGYPSEEDDLEDIESLYQKGLKIQETLTREGIVTTLKVHYQDEEIVFIPTKELTTEEEQIVYLALENCCFWDGEQRGFVMTEDDIDDFIEKQY